MKVLKTMVPDLETYLLLKSIFNSSVSSVDLE